jgi:acyl-CoA thioester hydrolase
MNNPTSQRKANPLTRRVTFSHWASEQVRFSDTDMLGHVNNASLATYYETGRTECVFKAISSDVGSSIVFVVARLSMDFLAEVHWPARIDIGTGIVAVGRASFTVGQGLFDGERCVGSAESVVVAIDPELRTPCAIPDWLRQRLLGLGANPASVE